MKKYISLLLIFATLAGCDLSSPTLSDTADPSLDEESSAVTNTPKIISFTASKSQINFGETVTLNWETENTDKVLLNPSVGSIEAKGTMDVVPQTSTIYSLVLFGPEGSNTNPVFNRITVYVVQPTSDSLPTDENITSEPPNNICDQLNNEEAIKQLHLETNTDTLIAGEALEIYWDSRGQFPIQNVELVLSDNENPLSTKAYGAKKITLLNDRVIKLTANICGKNFESAVPVQVSTPQKQKPSDINSLSLGAQNDLWAGGTNGDLIKFDRIKNKWSKISGVRVGIKTKDQTINDATPITSVLEMKGDCENDVYFGTQGGFLYRSHDGGKTVSGLNDGAYAVQFFTSDVTNPFDNPSPINFVASDPDNPASIYVGHSAGLVHFKDCHDPAADKADYLFPHKNVLASANADDAFNVLLDGNIHQIDSLKHWEILDTGDETVNWITNGLNHLFFGTDNHVSEYAAPHHQMVWDHEGNTLTQTENILFIGSPNGLYFKRNNGSSWMKVSGLDSPIKKLLPNQDENILWILTNQGDVYKLEGLL